MAFENAAIDLELNGIVFSIYQVRGQWKVAHPTIVRTRPGKSIVKNVPSRKAGADYAREYASEMV